ncbi:outer membrane beta-barrel family protein [Jejuia spongiicola]|uniref:TonB-dependent receptor n=1 Tax=Jejuia spongiicola TaxID=2942207 RepID=A0ABT0QCB8_9FLAO|nr:MULTISPECIES: outer membrane beta-barrel family protein [Flavobacteriaceae]MCL6294598.1 TonB-dependent receptor [Jejuia spongiicola]PIA78081.1 TonB-dependent receptor [Gaetbulibacter sp. 4G1]
MKQLFFVCLLLFSITTQANTTDPENSADKTGTISGKVLDAKLKQPLPYVNVIIKNNAGETLTGGITLEDGSFEIKKVEEGNVKVSIQYIGYKTITKDITIGKGNYKIDLGNILLEEEAEGLDAVTVIAETSTIQQKVDRKVITIGKDLAASGSASELMIGIPSVSVDAQTGDISLRGNQNVRVMVDGKLSNIPTAQLLKQIPSTAIKSIELITNPSAKYNPEGMSGIINIVLHKNTMIGFNGNFNIGLSHEKEAKFNSALNMNYRNGKFNLYGSYSNNISKNRNHGNVARPENNSEQFFKFLDKRQSHLYKVGLDFYLDDKNTISFFTTQNTSDSSTEGSTEALFYSNSSFNQRQLFTNDSDNSSSQYNFDYKHDFSKDGHNIELEVDYNTFEDDTPVDFKFLLGSNEDYKDFNNTDRKSTTVNLDYVNPLSETTKLELGLQARLFNSDIAYSSTGETLNDLGVLRPTPSTDFDYTRDIYSAYATFSKKFEKWTYQIGLRTENVKEDALALSSEAISTQTFKNDYFEFYPSAFITYSPSEKNSYQFSYSRRVDRPGIGQVNPIKEWSTPLISSFGNIDLRPQFTNSIEANYTRTLNNRKGSVTGGVFYRIISDEINRALFIDRSDVNSGRIILTHDNFDDTSAYGIELSTNYRPTKWWSINGSFDLYSQTQKGIAENLTAPIETATINDIETNIDEIDNVAWNLRMFNNFKVTKTISLTAFGFYRGKNRTLQFDMKPMYFVNIGSRVSFAKGKGSFSLNFNDILNTMNFAFEGTKPFVQVGQFNWESHTVQASLSYRFGGGKYRAKSRKRRDNNEKSGGGGFL